MFKALSRANREMQLDSWTPVSIDFATMMYIFETNDEHMITPADDLKSTAVFVFLQDWCKANIKQGFAAKREASSMNSFGPLKEDLTPCLTFLFKLSSEAVRFKLTWGGR